MTYQRPPLADEIAALRAEPAADATLTDKLSYWEARREQSRGTKDWAHANDRVLMYRRLARPVVVSEELRAFAAKQAARVSGIR